MTRGFTDIVITHITMVRGMILGTHILYMEVIMEVLLIVIAISFLTGVSIAVGTGILQETDELIPLMQVVPEVQTDH